MSNFVVDPMIATTPEPTAGAQPILTWFQSLEAWMKEVEYSPFFQWKHLLHCTTQIVSSGRFPTFDKLRALQRSCNADINIAYLARMAAVFFQSPEHDLIRQTSTRYAMSQDDDTQVTPMEFVERNLPDVHQPLIDNLLCLACDKSMGGESFARIAQFVTIPFAPPTRERKIRVESSIELTEPDDVLHRIKRSLDESFEVIFSPDELQAADIDKVIDAGGDSLCHHIRRVARRNHSGRALMTLTLGSQFVQSIESRAIRTDRTALEKLVRICAAVIADVGATININLRQVRTNKAGDSPQQRRARDNAAAWRATITKHGVGWRLQYWYVPPEQPGMLGTIELSIILGEQDAVFMPDAE